MEMNVKEQLVSSIENQIEALDAMEVGTNEYKTTVDGISKLLDKLNESDKYEFDYWNTQEAQNNEKEFKEKQLAQETELKEKQLAEERTDHIVKNGLTAFSIVTSVGLAIWGTYKSLKFEETGSITTIMGRGFISNLLPKKH